LEITAKISTLNPKEYKKLKPPIWRANKWEYFISFFTIAIGVFFQCLVLATDWPQSNNSGKIPGGLTEFQFASIFFILHFMGLYGLWRIHAGYNFIGLNSNLSIEEKRDVVNRAFERMNKKAPAMAGDSMTFHYKGFLWSMFVVTILLDNDNFYINAQSRKDRSGGMIDLGTSYRLMKRIRRNMRACLSQRPLTVDGRADKKLKSNDN
jgi:hypothetical protein